MSKLWKYATRNPMEAAIGVSAVVAIGYIGYNLLRRREVFRESSVTFKPEELVTPALKEIVTAIRDAEADGKFSYTEMRTLYSEFIRFCEDDKDGHKVLGKAGFIKLMASMGLDSGISSSLFDTWDADGSGSLNLTEILSAITLCRDGSSSDKLIAMFGIIDVDNDGQITKDEMLNFLINVCRITGRDPTRDRLRRVVDEFFEIGDRDFSFTLGQEEFVLLAKKAKFLMGETLIEYLDALTESFTESLGGAA